MKSWLKRHVVLVLTVVLPTFLAVVYFGLIASDTYISESRFVVRRSQQQAMPSGGSLGELLQSSGLTHSDDDTSLVQDYIRSRDALRELDEKLGVGKHYSNHAVDIFSRFPGFDWNGSFENFHRYYLTRVSLVLDSTSSASVLTVHAYTAEDAQKINDVLLQMAERLVNTLNERSRRDLIGFAERDVTAAEEKAKEATLALSEYRRKNSVFEPNKQAEIQFAGIEKLQEELVETETQVASMTKLAPGNPENAALKDRVTTLREAIVAEGAKITSANGSLSAHAAKIDRLLVDLDFADKLLGTSLASLEMARNQALRQELYLDRLVQPNLPDYAMEPRRVRSVFTVLAVGLILWGAVSLVLASIREHGE